tara:strand:- start:212 stop:334 length:123 start_codon:yes stop_codon:yes gene_type:complete
VKFNLSKCLAKFFYNQIPKIWEFYDLGKDKYEKNSVLDIS